jgi:hypothetical protein
MVTLVTTVQQILTKFWPAETEEVSSATTSYGRVVREKGPAFTVRATRLALLDKSGPATLESGGFKVRRMQASRCTSRNSPASADDKSREGSGRNATSASTFDLLFYTKDRGNTLFSSETSIIICQTI